MFIFVDQLCVDQSSYTLHQVISKRVSPNQYGQGLRNDDEE